MARGTKKRGAGEGTIYYREAKRLWCAQVTLDDGRRKTIYGKTQREVREKLTLLSGARDRGLPMVDGALTVKDYLMQWLEVVKPTVRESAWIRYKQLVWVHLIPGLGRQKLPKLSAHQVQQFYAKKLADGVVSATTVRRMHEVLHHALHDAMRLDLVVRNVTELVDAPRPNSREMQVLSSEQLAAFLEAASGKEERLGALYALAVTTGIRAGELLALHWRDVDLHCGTVTIRGSLTRTAKGYVIGETKTKSSRRTLTLPEVAHEALRMHRTWQLEQRMASGALWQEHDMVFASEVGTPLDPDNLRHRYQGFLRRHQLPRIRFHDLRHTAATVLLGEREDLKIISAQLGHSRIGVTADTYLHVSSDMQASAAKTMDRAIKRAMVKWRGRAENDGSES